MHKYKSYSPLFSMWTCPRSLFFLSSKRQQIRPIDNLDSRHVDNILDIPRLSTNEKAGVRGVVAENGRIFIPHLPVMSDLILSEFIVTFQHLTIENYQPFLSAW